MYELNIENNAMCGKIAFTRSIYLVLPDPHTESKRGVFRLEMSNIQHIVVVIALEN